MAEVLCGSHAHQKMNPLMHGRYAKTAIELRKMLRKFLSEIGESLNKVNPDM